MCVLYFAPCRYTSTRDIYFIVYFIYYPLLSTFFPFFLPQWNHISPSRRACREKADNSSFIIIPFCLHFSPSFSHSGIKFAPLICEKCTKMRAERREIILEIIETEEKYGRDLQIIIDEFYKPMLVAGN